MHPEQKDGKWGYVDGRKKVKIDFKYDYAYKFSDGLARVYNGKLHGSNLPSGGKFAFIDRSGVEVLPFQYDDALNFSEGLAAVNIGGKYEMRSGELKGVGSYTIPVLSGGKWGYIDTMGKEVIPFSFDNAYSFSEGMAQVEIINDGVVSERHINKNGEFIGEEVIRSNIPYIGEKDIGNGRIIKFSFTLNTHGDKKTISDYLIEIKKGNSFQETKGFNKINIEPDGSFSDGSTFSGIVKEGMVDCVFDSNGEQINCTAVPVK
ncbi:MAG: WG repeat-containing protein [Treponema sp.]|nr:WG repeat-containing protein [Treponema sp.]